MQYLSRHNGLLQCYIVTSTYLLTSLPNRSVSFASRSSSRRNRHIPPLARILSTRPSLPDPLTRGPPSTSCLANAGCHALFAPLVAHRSRRPRFRRRRAGAILSASYLRSSRPPPLPLPCPPPLPPSLATLPCHPPLPPSPPPACPSASSTCAAEVSGRARTIR